MTERAAVSARRGAHRDPLDDVAAPGFDLRHVNVDRPDPMVVVGVKQAAVGDGDAPKVSGPAAHGGVCLTEMDVRDPATDGDHRHDRNAHPGFASRGDRKRTAGKRRSRAGRVPARAVGANGAVLGATSPVRVTGCSASLLSGWPAAAGTSACVSAITDTIPGQPSGGLALCSVSSLEEGCPRGESAAARVPAP